jgi:hypothetical protein
MQVVRWRPAAFKLASAVFPAPNASGWPLMIPIAVGCGFTPGIGVAALTSLFPSEVIVSPKGTNRNGIDGVSFTVEFWPWDDIGVCRADSLDADGRSFAALVIHGPAEEAIGAIGSDNRPPLSELETYRSERGKRLEPRAV